MRTYTITVFIFLLDGIPALLIAYLETQAALVSKREGMGLQYPIT